MEPANNMETDKMLPYGLDASFCNDIILSFREQHKREFFAYCYGNYKASLQFQDFFVMMLCGGEL